MSRVLFLLAIVVSPGAHAWWGNGHEQVADIAWTQLKPLAKSEIAEILKAGDVDFRPKSDEEKDVRAAFRKAATWSDWAKDHKEGTFEDWIIAWNAKFQPGYDPKDANREAHRCKRWHYFDIPIRYKGEKPGVDGSNALIAMTTARYEFATMGRQEPKDRKGQCWWLYWITHVVGDLHQPLHCVSSYEFEANGDAGGNLFKLGIGFPDNPDRKMNLHALWDSGVETAIAVETWPIPSPESVSERWTAAYPPTSDEVSDMDVASWVTRGAKLAEEFAYTGIERDGVPSADYKAKQLDLCRKQAVLAGFHLAEEINRSLAPESGLKRVSHGD